MNSFTSEVTASTSSIRAVWPPEVTSNNRLRGFYPSAVIGDIAVREFTDAFNDHQRSLPSTVDRLSFRAITNVAGLQALEASGIHLEGALPLMSRDHSNRVIAYTSWNAPDRCITPTMLSTHNAALVKAVNPEKPDDRRASEQYSTGIIDASTDNRARQIYVSQFEPLYEAFDYDREDVGKLLANPDNTICFLRDEERIVSTAMAETALIEVDGHGLLQIAEITEAITHPGSRGQGLYKTISGLLTKHMLVNGQLELDALYGESNLAMPGVLRAAHRNGRNFSYMDRIRFGLQIASFGILQQNFHVTDGSETRPYNDFALSYIPLGDIR